MSDFKMAEASKQDEEKKNVVFVVVERGGSPFPLYKALYDSRHIPLSSQMSESIRLQFADRFQLDVLIAVFQSWCKSFADYDYKLTALPPTLKVFYKHDSLFYESTLWPDPYIHPQIGRVDNVNVKLSNDGFLYPPVSSLQVSSPTRRHTSFKTGVLWYPLKQVELQRFQSLQTWAINQHGWNPKQTTMKGWYTDQEDRVDIKIFNNQLKRQLTVTYEPGDPCHDFDETWWVPEELEENPNPIDKNQTSDQPPVKQ